jgi:hypothetical protein
MIFIECMTVNRYAIILSGLLTFGCRSSQMQESHLIDRTGAAIFDTTSFSQHPTAHRFTIVTFSGIIDSVFLIDSASYKLRVIIVNSDGESEESPPAGRTIEILPDFILNEHWRIDYGASRNKQLLQLRSAVRGDTLRGTILHDNQYRWKLIGIGDK